jgi:integrase
LLPRLDTPLLFPAPEGGYLSLDNWRTREWYDALESAGVEKRGPCHLRHTFATEALASAISIFVEAAGVITSGAALRDRCIRTRA